MAVPKFLVALALVGVIDAISYMVVAPSIVFYVLENGGSREQYGIILSAFSFSSFCAKPIVGWWSDGHGFRLPYMLCLAVSALGGLVYLLASAKVFYGRTSVALILLGRLLGGVGAASSALGFAYLAKAVSHDDQTKTNSLLSMTRIVGMTTGPVLNVFLANIDFEVFGFAIDPLNSVGLVLMATNLLALLSIYLFLEEPAEDHTAPRHNENKQSTNGDDKLDPDNNQSSLWLMLQSLCCLDIMVPIFSIFAFNANFQLVECALAPAAHHGLGWTPVGISGILGSVSIVIFVNMMIVFTLSAKGVRDENLLVFGATLSAVGYFLVWYWWTWQAPPWQFIVPVFMGISAFPFLGAPTRSVFTKAVDRIDVLQDHQGVMQSLLGMFASVAGFVAPSLVAAYVLRDPEEVEESSPPQRELTAWALASPVMSVMMLVGVLAVRIQRGRREKLAELAEEAAGPDETTGLLDGGERRRRSSATTQAQKKQRYSTGVEVDRRRSTVCMGMVQSSMQDEHQMHEDYDAPEDEPDHGKAEI